MTQGSGTFFDRLWRDHEVESIDEARSIVFIDRLLLHELSTPRAFLNLERRGASVRHPELAFAMSDHIVATNPGRGYDTVPGGAELLTALRHNAEVNNIVHFDVNDLRQGIVHVVAPELGIVLPGITAVCGDSHTCTIGGIGALGWGVGTSEIEHVLATQTLVMTKPKTLAIEIEGRLSPGVSAKDVILALIAHFGVAAGTGYAVEYQGSLVRALDVESRMTLCNMSIEFGARIGIVTPDDPVFQYLSGAPFAPQGQAFDVAVSHWRTMASADDAAFDERLKLDVGTLEPQISFGTTPGDCIPVTGRVPSAVDAKADRSLTYMGLKPGQRIAGTPIDTVFIGSCANGRLSDLRESASILAGNRVAEGVRCIVVPGSQTVKRAAEAEGLDRVFRDAGFEWREPGCSMCPGLNQDRAGSGERVVSTTNRNFENRQGAGARTHIASPATAAASALEGAIADPRRYRKGSP